jgi:hypothetical protein
LRVESSWNVMAHGDAREGKWRGNWRIDWVASTLHTTSEHGVSSITTADAHTSAASSWLIWPPLHPADLNRLVRFAERRNLVSGRAPSHFKRSLPSQWRVLDPRHVTAHCDCAFRHMNFITSAREATFQVHGYVQELGGSWWWAQECPKHVERNKNTIKFWWFQDYCASGWFFIQCCQRSYCLQARINPYSANVENMVNS